MEMRGVRETAPMIEPLFGVAFYANDSALRSEFLPPAVYSEMSGDKLS